METDSNIWSFPEDRARLEGRVASRNTPQKLVWKACLDQHNADAKAFVWASHAEDFLEKVAKGRRTLESHASEPARAHGTDGPSP